MKIVEGITAANMVNKKWGMAQLQNLGAESAQVRPAVFNLTSLKVSSIFGETFAALIENSLSATAVTHLPPQATHH
jgi:hypothetical protein